MMIERAVQIVNRNGLHARPAAEVVKTAAKFKSEITIMRDDLEVNGKSIMGVMMLAASNGSTSRSITISHPGVYWVSVSINGCSDIDTINVFAQTENCECIALLPTAFSPNGDQKNDVLRIIHSKNVVLKKFYVFNRWGETVFIANDFSEVWDGSYKGEQVGQGTYYYFFEYFCPLDQQNYRVKGDVTIVR